MRYMNVPSYNALTSKDKHIKVTRELCEVVNGVGVAMDGVSAGIAAETERAENAEAALASDIEDLQAMEQIVIDGGEAQIAQGSDFTDADATKRAKVPTVGAILDGLNDGVYDVSARNGGTTFESLSALLSSNNLSTLIPTSWRKGGMSIRFVQSSDNNSVYVQYRLTKNTWSTAEGDWQGVDAEPAASSKNLVESGGVYDILYGETTSEIVSLDVTAGTVVTTDGSKREVNLVANRVYKLNISNNRSNGTGVTLYCRKSMSDGSVVSLKASQDKNSVDAAPTADFVSITSAITTIYIKPSANVGMVNFYAAAASVKDTTTITFNFLWEADGDGLVGRVEALEDSDAVPTDGSVKMVKSGGVWSAVDNVSFSTNEKVNETGIDAAPTKDSNNLVESGGVYDELEELDITINGIPTVNLSGVIPIVAGQVNQQASGAYCDINIPAGSYLFSIDALYLGASTYIYATINGTSTYLNTLGNLNNKTVTFDNDVTSISVYAVAANSLLTGNCSFSFVQESVRGMKDDIADLEDDMADVKGSSNTTDVKFTLKTTLQTDSETKTAVDIKRGTYWVDVSPLSLLTTSAVNVYAYYKSNPSQGVYIGAISNLLQTYWKIGLVELLQEVTFEDDVVALSLYHVNNATGAGVITISFVDENPELSIDNKIENLTRHNNPSFTAFKDSGTIGSTERIVLPEIKVSKSYSLFAEINGVVDSVAFGVGYDASKATLHGYTAYWIVLTPTEVELWMNDNANNKIGTFEHGLTLDEYTRISIIKAGGGSLATLRIVTKLGDEYVNQNLSWQGVGAPFVENNNASGSVNVSVDFFPRDLSKKIWVFGDSYCALGNPERWPTQMTSYGIEGYLMNAQGGEAMREGYYELCNLLTLGYNPTYIVWALGMNGEGDAAGATDASAASQYQRLWLMRFLRVCKEKGITPILCTIPSVPNTNHHALSAYVRSLGYRYIDFADAVGSQVDGTWYSGLLSSDNAHPSEAGAKVLAMRVLDNFPEITLL